VIIWIHIFGSADMCICLCKDTGAMNPPLRLAECSQPISWNVRNGFWVLESVGQL